MYCMLVYTVDVWFPRRKVPLSPHPHHHTTTPLPPGRRSVSLLTIYPLGMIDNSRIYLQRTLPTLLVRPE